MSDSSMTWEDPSTDPSATKKGGFDLRVPGTKSASGVKSALKTTPNTSPVRPSSPITPNPFDIATMGPGLPDYRNALFMVIKPDPNDYLDAYMHMLMPDGRIKLFMEDKIKSVPQYFMHEQDRDPVIPDAPK